MCDELTTERRFWDFHKANPHVYAKLRELAFEARRIGHQRVGIDLLLARFRWETPAVTEDAASPYKVANDYKPYYARLLMVQESELLEPPLFQIKRLQVPEPHWSRHLLPEVANGAVVPEPEPIALF